MTRPRRYFFFLSPLSLMMRPGSSWLMVDGSRRGQDVRNGVQRTSGYLDEISFPLGSPAASRDSFSLYSRKIFASIESRSFSRFREISNYARKIRLFFFFFFFKKEEKKNDRSFFFSLSLFFLRTEVPLSEDVCRKASPRFNPKTAAGKKRGRLYYVLIGVTETSMAAMVKEGRKRWLRV